MLLAGKFFVFTGDSAAPSVITEKEKKIKSSKTIVKEIFHVFK